MFDEATSALDNETEKAVMESIEKLQGSKTMIIIAHRLTTVEHCDNIYEVKGGKVIHKDKQEICNQLNRRTEFIVLRTTYGLFDKDGKLKQKTEQTKKTSTTDNKEDFDFYIE